MSIELLKRALDALKSSKINIADCGDYADECFQIKHDLDNDIKANDDLIEEIERFIEKPLPDLVDYRFQDRERIIDDIEKILNDFRTDGGRIKNIAADIMNIFVFHAKPLLDPIGYVNPDHFNSYMFYGMDSTRIWEEKGCNGISMPLYAEPPARNKWQPIETAPKDGAEILLFAIGDIGVCYWSDEIKCWTWGNGKKFLNPSHWMALSESPKLESAHGIKEQE
jgi:hypothetical protein